MELGVGSHPNARYQDHDFEAQQGINMSTARKNGDQNVIFHLILCHAMSQAP